LNSPFLWNPIAANNSQQSQSGLLNGGSLAGGYSLGGQTDGYQTGFMPTAQPSYGVSQQPNNDASNLPVQWKLPGSNQNDGTTNAQGIVGGPQNTNTQVLAQQGQSLGADGKPMMGATPQQPLLTTGGNTSPFSSLSDLGKSIPQQGNVGQQAPLAQLGWPTMNTLSF